MHVRFLSFLFLGAAAWAHAEGPYQLDKEIPVSGEGGWDCLTVDAPAHRLYLTHGTSIVVIDTTTDTVVGEIRELSGVHDFALAPKHGVGFASNGRENKVCVIDLSSLETLSKVPTGLNPDIMLYDSGRDEVYAFNGRSKSATVITARTGVVVATVVLGGKPEFAQADGSRVFVNVEDKNEVAVLDTKTHAIVNRWPIAPGAGATGMGIDHEHHRLFLGCGNAKLVVLDSQDGHVVAVLPAGTGIDGAAFDPGTQLAFTPNGGDGTVTVVHEDAPDSFTVVQTLATARSARTMALDPATHKLYLPCAKFEQPKPGDTKRPKMIPGTLKVLVYALQG